MVEEASESPESAHIGRRYVLAAVIALVLTELAVTGAYVARLGTGQLPQQTIRFILVLGLGYALLKRKSWARWVTVVLLLIACWILTKPLLTRGAFAGDRLLRTLPLLALFVGYGIIVRGFIYSQSVWAYFERSDDRRVIDSAS
jgi:hypothetical protein